MSNKDILKPLKTTLKRISSNTMLHKLGLAVRHIILTRTAQGIDVEGDPFQEYSEEYAKRRKKMGLPTHPVNLTVEDAGGMINSIDHLVSRDASKVLVYIKNSRNRRVAGYHNIHGAGKSKVIRKFWGLNNEEERSVVSVIGNELEALIKGI